jgi:hypothetical protein
MQTYLPFLQATVTLFVTMALSCRQNGYSKWTFLPFRRLSGSGLAAPFQGERIFCRRQKLVKKEPFRPGEKIPGMLVETDKNQVAKFGAFICFRHFCSGNTYLFTHLCIK